MSLFTFMFDDNETAVLSILSPVPVLSFMNAKTRTATGMSAITINNLFNRYSFFIGGYVYKSLRL